MHQDCINMSRFRLDKPTRQHFQGLRRAQHKSEGGVATASPDPNRRVDPTLNPITRRPGPGRGRPKKQQNTAQGQSPASTASVSETGTTGPSVTPIPPPVVPGAPGQSTTAIPVPVVPGMPAPPGGMHPAAMAQVHAQAQAQAQAYAQQQHAQAQLQAHAQAQAHNQAQAQQARVQQNGRGGNQAGGQGPANQGVQAQSGGQSADGDDVAVDPSLEDGDNDEQQHPNKRRKMEQDPLDDAAVLNALAAHNDPASTAAHFAPELKVPTTLIAGRYALSSTFSTSTIVFCPLRLVLQDGHEHHTCNEYGFFYAFHGLRYSFRYKSPVLLSLVSYSLPVMKYDNSVLIASRLSFPSFGSTSTIWSSSSHQPIAAHVELNKPVNRTVLRASRPTTLVTMSNADEIPKESKWGNDAHSALCVALAEALIAAGSSPAQKKDLIMAVMKACGQLGFTWESVRYQKRVFLFLPCPFLPPSLLPQNFCDIYATTTNGSTFCPTTQPFLPRSHRKMPRWDEQTHIDLMIALYTALQPSMTKEIQDFVVEAMRSKGHEDVGWDALRCIRVLSPFPQTHKDPASSSPFSHPSTKTYFTSTESPRIAIKMPKWEEIRDDLFRAYMNATGVITPEMQVSIEKSMQPYDPPTAGLDPALSVCAISSLPFWSCSSLPPSPQQPTWSIAAGSPIPSSHLNTTNISNSVTMSSQRSAQRNLTRWDQKTHEDIMLAMFEHFRPTAADMKEIVELLHVQKGHTFTDGALFLKMEEEDHEAQFYVAKASKPTNWDHDAHLTLLQAVMIEALPSKPHAVRIQARSCRFFCRIPPGWAHHHVCSPASSIMVDSETEKVAETRMTWNHNADKHLIGCVVDEIVPGEETYRNLAARMNTLGYGCTPKAVKQHLQKLRRKEGVSAAVASDSGANTSTPTKGRKRAAPGSGVKKTPGTGRGKKAAAAKTAPLVINSDDEDDIKESPEKKLKTEESKVKEEYDDGVDDYMYPNEI
ncbi:hypothetical protein NEUTE1DRAFT_123234 [Neurospora tetrasperma FGSC 2508]|nr:uncharacterized protein NEUTE1DRAFT_123234 [Neurospora tetrasperma FGSC 2508]EGO56775.1 hypothetical protein NEUTE1DRAFT_123234 [Neurospora tetrasperma FGSC 2508]